MKKDFFGEAQHLAHRGEEKLKRGKWKICKEGKISSKKEKEKRENTVGAQHMNCAGANLALPRKCTIALDQYIL